jgi:hypothetical protein
MFFWPGSPSSDVGKVWIPLDKVIGQNDVRLILSNRRFRKVLQELSALPKSAAGALVSRAIMDEMPRYTKLFSDYVASCDLRTPMDRSKPAIGAQPLEISTPADDSVVLVGSRLKLLSLVLLAGALELQESREAVVAVVRVATETYREMATAAKRTPFVAHGILTQASLYNRQVLYTGLVGVGCAKREQSVEWTMEEVGPYDARATPYDLHARQGFVPVEKHSRIAIEFATGVSDGQFLRAAEQLLGKG